MWLATPRGWCLIGRLWLERGVAGRSVLLSEAISLGCERERVEVPCFTYPYPHTHTVCVHVCEVRGKDERTKGRTERRGRREDTERSPRDRARLSREKQANLTAKDRHNHPHSTVDPAWYYPGYSYC